MTGDVPLPPTLRISLGVTGIIRSANSPTCAPSIPAESIAGKYIVWTAVHDLICLTSVCDEDGRFNVILRDELAYYVRIIDLEVRLFLKFKLYIETVEDSFELWIRFS